MSPEHLLAWNAGAQITFACLLGWAMLIPRQPWARGLRRLRARDLTAAHLDWLMLAFMQFGASYMMTRQAMPHARVIAYLLIAGGWINPVPYVLRGLGIDAFALAGDWRQRTSAAISAVSSLAITGAWIAILAAAW